MANAKKMAAAVTRKKVAAAEKKVAAVAKKVTAENKASEATKAREEAKKVEDEKLLNTVINVTQNQAQDRAFLKGILLDNRHNEDSGSSLDSPKDMKRKKKKKNPLQEISVEDDNKKAKIETGSVIKQQVTTKVEESVTKRDKKGIDKLCVKSQKRAMKQARITEKTKFAMIIKKGVLEGKWNKAFVKEFEDSNKFKKLWWGETKYIALGTASMTALEVT
eukprot:scaffold221418_cov54-Attheya_sp.AAC.3